MIYSCILCKTGIITHKKVYKITSKTLNKNGDVFQKQHILSSHKLMVQKCPTIYRFGIMYRFDLVLSSYSCDFLSLFQQIFYHHTLSKAYNSLFGSSFLPATITIGYRCTYTYTYTKVSCGRFQNFNFTMSSALCPAPQPLFYNHLI